jgi:hypothetical protein
MVLLTSIVIAGCASHSVDCTMGAGQNGCTPGTKEYEQMMQRQQDAKSSDEIDDAVCRSFGAEPGSMTYAECRHKRAGDRQLFEPTHTPQAGSLPK